MLFDLQSIAARVRRAVIFRLARSKHRDHALTISEAVDLALSEQPINVGVDVFDTVVVRRVATDATTEQIIANRVAGRAIWPGTPAEFLAEYRRVQREDPLDFSLRSWLSSMARDLDFDTKAAEQVFIQTERELLRAVPGALEALKRVRLAASLTFVSDMHLSGESLRGLLASLDLFEQDDSIVVSADVGASKADGRIFQSDFIRELDFDRHSAFIGNDLWSDVTQPRNVSIPAYPTTAGNLSRFERLMAGNPISDGPAIASAARLHRLACATDHHAPEARVRELGGQVIGQSMLAFLGWARDRCEANGVRHLAFLARDGELPLDMARAMPSDHWHGFELRYLHCGRQSWSLAAASIVGVDEWIHLGTSDDGAFLLHSATRTPFANLLNRCGMKVSNVPRNRGLDASSPNLPLTPAAAAAWKDLLKSGDLNDKIAEASAPARTEVVTYLKQTNFPAERTALVDVGWRGRQAWLVSALVEEATGFEPIHLHFGGDRVSSEIDAMVNIERFAFDDSKRPHPVSSPVACVEMFLGSGKPRLLGYDTDDSGIVHQVFEAESSPVDNPHRRALADGAIEVAGMMPSRAELTEWGLGGQPLDEEARSILAALWNAPTSHEARLLSPLKFEGDDSGGTIGPVIQSYGLASLVRSDAVPRVWREASLRLTTPGLRHVVKASLALRDRLKAKQSR